MNNNEAAKNLIKAFEEFVNSLSVQAVEKPVEVPAEAPPAKPPKAKKTKAAPVVETPVEEAVAEPEEAPVEVEMMVDPDTVLPTAEELGEMTVEELETICNSLAVQLNGKDNSKDEMVLVLNYIFDRVSGLGDADIQPTEDDLTFIYEACGVDSEEGLDDFLEQAAEVLGQNVHQEGGEDSEETEESAEGEGLSIDSIVAEVEKMEIDWTEAKEQTLKYFAQFPDRVQGFDLARLATKRAAKPNFILAYSVMLTGMSDDNGDLIPFGVPYIYEGSWWADGEEIKTAPFDKNAEYVIADDEQAQEIGVTQEDVDKSLEDARAGEPTIGATYANQYVLIDDDRAVRVDLIKTRPTGILRKPKK